MNTRPLLWGVGLVVVALVGYGLARLVLPSPESASRGTTATRSTLTSPAASSTSASSSRASAVAVIAASDRSQQGAVMVADRYLGALEQTLVTGSARGSAVLRQLTVAPLTARALVAQTAAMVVARKIASAPGEMFTQGWRLGHRVDTYTPSRARVEVWTMGVMAGAAGVIAPDYSTTTCRLRWTDQGWKVTAAQTTPGPTPPPDDSDPAAVTTFGRSAARFQPFHDAP